MIAEVIVVSGALSGDRRVLANEAALIGRDPNAFLPLDDPAIAWRHCTISFEQGRFHLVDLRSGSGTYVNGARVARHSLDDGDQIHVGGTALEFRQRLAPPLMDDAQPTLLRASALLFLFRALAAATEPEPRSLVESQLLQLLFDLLPCDRGMILLGKSEAELRRQAAEVSPDPGSFAHDVSRLIARVLKGPADDEESSCIVTPICARGSLAGLIALRLRETNRQEATDHNQTLAAIATLASAALESEQEIETLRTENACLKVRLSGFVGESAATQRLLKLIGKVAPQETTVLIQGESGTGKELVARALHQQSPRRDRPFIAINCAALTETLLESELFGHEKGAFTGAVAQKKGRLELAEGGVLFLDEIGELAASLQAKLLRVLQQREFERVGGGRTLKLDVRLIAATNRDLAEEARKGRFREDLYHRLNVITLRTPPLRERPDDIPPLARHFLSLSAERCRRQIAGISHEAERCLLQYPWPGNVRELENAIERAVVLGGDSDWIEPDDLPDAILASGQRAIASNGYQETVLDARRDSILRAWEQAGGQYKEAARLLGLHPNSLLRLLRKLEMRELVK